MNSKYDKQWEVLWHYKVSTDPMTRHHSQKFDNELYAKRFANSLKDISRTGIEFKVKIIYSEVIDVS